MSFSTLFFDLDDTLYSPTNGVWHAILQRIELYMHERLAIPTVDIPRLREELFQQYGTTLRGLQILWHVDELEFVDFVHDVPIDRLLAPDPHLRALLASYPQRKFIFTNADRNHAGRVLNRLQVADCFEGVVDILDVSPYCKPMPEAFATAMHKAGVSDPRECMFLDDGLKNLAAARALGFYTVRVGSREQHPACHASIAHLGELPEILDPLLASN
jgi:putative hydrolase of the HAD superfamily